MKPVTFLHEVDNTLGALGYSVLRLCEDGVTAERYTLLYLRHHNGIAKGTVIAPAETLREVIF